MHDGQSVAQKVTIAGLPRHSRNATCFPVIRVNVTSGACPIILGIAIQASHTTKANTGSPNKNFALDNRNLFFSRPFLRDGHKPYLFIKFDYTKSIRQRTELNGRNAVAQRFSGL
jgi:hypothetical protein